MLEVVLSNTICDPTAMMVHSDHTATTSTAVVSPRWLKTVASIAKIQEFRLKVIILILWKGHTWALFAVEKFIHLFFIVALLTILLLFFFDCSNFKNIYSLWVWRIWKYRSWCIVNFHLWLNRLNSLIQNFKHIICLRTRYLTVTSILHAYEFACFIFSLWFINI